MIAIENGKVLLPDGSFLEKGTVLVEGGKIKAVGENVEVPEDAQVIDASGKWVTPGLIDALHIQRTQLAPHPQRRQ